MTEQPPATPPSTALVSTILDSFRSHQDGTWETLAEHVASTLIAEGFVRAGAVPDTGHPAAPELVFAYGGDGNGNTMCPCGHHGVSHGADGESSAIRAGLAKDPCRLCACVGFRLAASASPSGDTGH